MAKKKIEEVVDISNVEETIETLTATVTAEKLNLRKKANTSSEVVRILNKGEEVLVCLNLVNGFYELADGTGFIMSDYVTVK